MTPPPKPPRKKSYNPLQIDRTGQFSLFEKDVTCPPKTATPSQRIFIRPSPDTLRYGAEPLKNFLKRQNIKAPFIVRELLEQQDWSTFEQQYSTVGRPPYAPMNMAGLILYGVMHGISSLRGLEAMAKTDLGSHWVTGGISPDHASLGRNGTAFYQWQQVALHAFA